MKMSKVVLLRLFIVLVISKLLMPCYGMEEDRAAELDKKIEQLLMVGFQGTHPEEEEPNQWQKLYPVLNARVAQEHLKMKLEESEARSLKNFLKSTNDTFPHLTNLQSILPKTTLELLMAIHKRGLPEDEAELMADYLKGIVDTFEFQNIGSFDENTSHIIGRQWHEIDYSGEGMTWEKQKTLYAPDGIEHFKSRDCLEKFFKVESKLPYFRRIYKPNHPEALKDRG